MALTQIGKTADTVIQNIHAYYSSVFMDYLYYDNIIRIERELSEIRKHIKENLLKANISNIF